MVLKTSRIVSSLLKLNTKKSKPAEMVCEILNVIKTRYF
jgi:hypothetical protein